MSLDDLKELLVKVSHGRRDAAEELAERLFPLLEMLEKKVEPKPKKAAK